MNVRTILRVSVFFAGGKRPAASASRSAAQLKTILALVLLGGTLPSWAQSGAGIPQVPPSGPATRREPSRQKTARFRGS